MTLDEFRASRSSTPIAGNHVWFYRGPKHGAMIWTLRDGLFHFTVRHSERVSEQAAAPTLPEAEKRLFEYLTAGKSTT